MNTLLQTFKQQLLADKKKSIAMGALLCVLIVVAIRAFASGSGNAPELASAVQPRAAVANPVNPPMRPVLEKISTPPQIEKPVTTSAPPIALKHRTVTTAGLPRALKRDFFMTDEWSKYPLEASQIQEGKAPGGSDFWMSLTAAMRQYGRQRREEAATLNKELSELQLQSTLTGLDPLAYISGHLVRPGDHCAGFFILRIEERRVVLEKYGQVHELVMR